MGPLIDAVRHNLRNLLRFSGRERRGSFWLYVLALYVAQMALGMLVTIPLMAGTFGRPGPGAAANMFGTILLFSAICGAMFVFLLAASAVRRLHDSGWSGLWTLLPLPFLITGFWGMHQIRSKIHAGGDPGGSFGLMMANNLIYLAVLGFLIFLLARSGTAGPNRYGPDPREKPDGGRL
jgi:uncharacterized membrane protein YhaH (DUF805 family)